LRFNKGFYEKIKELGWDKKIEIKGNYIYSNLKGDKNIPVKERLDFVEKLFELSKTSSERYAASKNYITFDIFPRNELENNMYINQLDKILNELPKGLKKGNRNGKNNIIIFIDNNNALNLLEITKKVKEILEKRNLYLIEKCVYVNSCNETPGIIFADFVGYFIHNYIKTTRFNSSNKDRFKLLLKKFSKNSINNQEKKEFDRFITSFKKEKKSSKLLMSLKKMIII